MAADAIKVVAAGSFAQGASEAALGQGLREHGWLVEEVDSARHFEARTLAERLERRVRALQFRARYNADILAACKRVQPDVMFTVKGTGISPNTLHRLASDGIVTINYFPDYHLSDVPLEALRAYAMVITTKSFQLEYLRDELSSRRVQFVHHGFSPLLHRPRECEDGELTTDIAYVGNASPYKASVLMPLIDAFPAETVQIYGAGWEKYQKTRLARAIVGHRVAPDFMAYVIGRARINLALHMGKTVSSKWEDLVSTRTFEIPACGGFMLHIDNDEVRSLFDVPSEIDVFHDVKELVAKTRYYLDHPAEREAIAARGHARAVPAYSYSARAREVAEIIEPLIEKSKARSAA